MNINILQCIFSIFIIVIIFPNIQITITKYITYVRIFLRRKYRACNTTVLTEEKKLYEEDEDSDEDLPP